MSEYLDHKTLQQRQEMHLWRVDTDPFYRMEKKIDKLLQLTRKPDTKNFKQRLENINYIATKGKHIEDGNVLLNDLKEYFK